MHPCLTIYLSFVTRDHTFLTHHIPVVKVLLLKQNLQINNDNYNANYFLSDLIEINSINISTI